MTGSYDGSDWENQEIEVEAPSPQALMSCLEYLIMEADQAGYPIAANLIAAAAEALVTEVGKSDYPIALSAENVIALRPGMLPRN